MKKLSYFLLAAAGLTLASCSNEEFVNPSIKGDGNYNVTVQLPGAFGTRTTNDGLTATKLFVGIFDADNENVFVAEAQAADFSSTSLSTNVSMNLATGKSYTIAFFAYAPGQFSIIEDENTPSNTVYTLNKTTGNMTVNYDAMFQNGMNKDLYDCFFKVISTGKIGTDTYEPNVLLTRPIAQINWGTNDFAEPTISDANAFGTNLQYATPSLTTDAYNTFSFVNGDVTGDKVAVELDGFTAPTDFQYPNVPGSTITNNVNTTYKYVGMQYLLAPVATSATYDLTLNVSNEGTAENPNTATTLQNKIVVSAAPVQANYQTNIYGALLTDNYNFTVTKSAAWAGSYLAPQVEGEETAENSGLFYDEATKTYTIMNEKGLNTYITTVANQTQQQGLSAYTVILGADLDMNLYQSSFGTYTPFSNAGAKFDGQGHTISNLKVSATGKNSAGFMTSAIGTVSNLNFTNATITGNYKAGVLAGDGLVAKINNITVTKSTVTVTPWVEDGVNYDGNNVGGVVGYLSAEGNAYVTNCTVTGSTIKAYRSVGGIVGKINGANCLVQNNTVTNTSVIADQQITGTYDPEDAGKPIANGEIYGDNAGNSVPANNITGNTENNVSVLTINSAGQFVADNLDQLQAIADLTFDNKFALNGKTIIFGEQGQTYDLKGATIPPVIISFSGDNNTVVDFNYCTISNFTIDGGYDDLGFIGKWSGAIKNLTIDNMTLSTGTYNAGGVIGYFTGTMENVTIQNSNFNSNSDNLGALAGNSVGSTFTNCKVIDCNITGKVGYGIGGAVGTITENDAMTFTNVAVTGTKITSTGSASGAEAGIIWGNNLNNVTIDVSGITVTGSTVNGEAAVAPSSN